MFYNALLYNLFIIKLIYMISFKICMLHYEKKYNNSEDNRTYENHF